MQDFWRIWNDLPTIVIENYCKDTGTLGVMSGSEIVGIERLDLYGIG